MVVIFLLLLHASCIILVDDDDDKSTLSHFWAAKTCLNLTLVDPKPSGDELPMSSAVDGIKQ